MLFKLISVKGTRVIDDDEVDPIEAAMAMDAELQPAFGISVENETGRIVAEVREGRVLFTDHW